MRRDEDDGTPLLILGVYKISKIPISKGFTQILDESIIYLIFNHTLTF